MSPRSPSVANAGQPQIRTMSGPSRHRHILPIAALLLLAGISAWLSLQSGQQEPALPSGKQDARPTWEDPRRQPAGTFATISEEPGGSSLQRDVVSSTPAENLNPHQPSGSRIHGTVVDDRNRPIAGARIVHASAEQRTVVYSDDAGRYETRLTWRTGRSTPTLRVVALGFQATTIDLVDHRQRLLRNDADIRADATLTPGSVILGRALSGTKPIAKARIDTTCETVGGSAPPPTFTDASGEFAINVQPGHRYVVRASSGTFGIGEARGLLAAESIDGARHDIQLHPTSTLRCRFTYPNGQPIAGLRLLARQARALDTGPGATATGGTTDAAGYAEFLGLANGQYRMVVPELMCDAIQSSLPLQSTNAPNRDIVIACCRILAQQAGDGAWDPRDPTSLRWKERVAEGAEPNSASAPTSVSRRLAPPTRRLVPYRSRWELQRNGVTVAVAIADEALGHELPVRVTIDE